jgi:hypothetical protein
MHFTLSDDGLQHLNHLRVKQGLMEDRRDLVREMDGDVSFQDFLAAARLGCIQQSFCFTPFAPEDIGGLFTQRGNLLRAEQARQDEVARFLVSSGICSSDHINKTPVKLGLRGHLT